MTCTWLAWVGIAATFAAPAAMSRYEFTQVHMGVSFTILLYSHDEALANRAADAAFDRVDQLNSIMSDYDPDSELMQLCRTAGHGEPVAVSDELYDILTQSAEISDASEGAFDVTVGPLVRLWRRARRQHEFPDDARLEEARQAVGYQHVHLDENAKRVRLRRDGMRLDLGGIAKGYAADAALEVLRRHGITRALIDASGDVVAGDPPPEREAWQIGIAPLESGDGEPSRFVALANAAIATSGDAFQYVELGGRRFSHIIDPRTGWPLTDRMSTSVIAPSGTTADALASAVSVLGPEKGLRLIDQMPDTAAFVVLRRGDKTETFASDRWLARSRESKQPDSP